MVEMSSAHMGRKKRLNIVNILLYYLTVISLTLTHLQPKPVLNKNNVKTTILAITQKANTIRFRLNLPFNSGIFFAQIRASALHIHNKDSP
jgi:hypothetical protein